MIDLCQLIEQRNFCFRVFNDSFNNNIANTKVDIADELSIAFNSSALFLDYFLF